MPATGIIVIDGQFEEYSEPFAPHIMAYATRTPQVAEIVPHLRLEADAAYQTLGTTVFTGKVVFITPNIEVATE